MNWGDNVFKRTSFWSLSPFKHDYILLILRQKCAGRRNKSDCYLHGLANFNPLPVKIFNCMLVSKPPEVKIQQFLGLPQIWDRSLSLTMCYQNLFLGLLIPPGWLLVSFTGPSITHTHTYTTPGSTCSEDNNVADWQHLRETDWITTWIVIHRCCV